MRAWVLLLKTRMRPQSSTTNQIERPDDDRRIAAVSARESFRDSDNRYSEQSNKRHTGGVDGLLRANASLVHEIE